jgi:3-methyladenine DNA glycosylase AlkD
MVQDTKTSIILSQIRKELKQNADEHAKNTAQHFFKEAVRVYGVKTAVVAKISKKYLQQIRESSKSDIFKLCEALFSSGYMEESFIACNWSYHVKGQYKPEDIAIFHRWLKDYVSNWASCDTLCNHTIGAFVEMYPQCIKELKKWAKSENIWIRRASAVTLIIPARNGKFLEDIFKIADLLLQDKEDLVQKGYGWMLKAASQAHQREVFDYVIKNKDSMPRTALRYAIEKMPESLRKKAMA